MEDKFLEITLSVLVPSLHHVVQVTWNFMSSKAKTPQQLKKTEEDDCHLDIGVPH
jgi:hypothetical protein